MKDFSLLLKPASADCNLGCRYCFYIDRAGLYPASRQHRMSDLVLQTLVSKYMASEQPVYAFGWQGGEPALMGTEFFERVTELQKKYGRQGALVANALQTNGTLIDRRLARHLAAYRFLVGVSLDGPAPVHDLYRTRLGGQGSHADTVRGIRTLQAHGVELNILVLVSRANAERATEVYDYLCDNGWYFHQYIPCLELDAANRPLPFSLTGEQWGDFLCALFDRWTANGPGRVWVRLFESLLARLLDRPANLCHLDHDCRHYFVVEHNGDVYPCDFFVRQELRLGNLLQHDWDELARSPVYQRFGPAKRDRDPACAACEYLLLCAGDCLKHRAFPDPLAGGRRLSHLCSGWKHFFAHALPWLRRMADEMRATEQAAGSADGGRPKTAPTAREPGRNDPCPCGSGKKYKRCCAGGVAGGYRG